jgi:hypothetical protein
MLEYPTSPSVPVLGVMIGSAQAIVPVGPLLQTAISPWVAGVATLA